jgi:hypothetical protein
VIAAGGVGPPAVTPRTSKIAEVPHARPETVYVVAEVVPTVTPARATV